MMSSSKTIYHIFFMTTIFTLFVSSALSCSGTSLFNDAGVDGFFDGGDNADGNKATWLKPAGYASVTFFVDDTANRTYASKELSWIGSFIYDPETNIASFDPNWAPELGSYPLLYDDGPVSESGHEMPGATAGDHIFSTEIYLLADDGRDMVYQYGLVNSEGKWLWSGPVGSFVVPSGTTERICADGFFVPSFGSYDLKLLLDTSQLNSTAWPFDPSDGRIDISGSMISWEKKQVFDDGDLQLHGDQVAGDGVYSFIQSLNLGPHDGLLNAGQRVNFDFYVDGVPYVTGQLPTPGVSAWVNCNGSFEKSAVFVQPDPRTGDMRSVVAVCDDRGSVPLTSVVPSTGPSAGACRVSIYGHGFLSGAQVVFGSRPAKDIQVVDTGLINCSVPASSSGQVDVRVLNPDGEFGLLIDAYTYYERLDPEVRFVSEKKGKTTGGDTLMISGVEFAENATVTFGGIEASSVELMDSRRIRCKSPAHPAGKVSVCVINPDGTYGCKEKGFEFSDDLLVPDIWALMEKPIWMMLRQDEGGTSALLARVFVPGITQYSGCHQDLAAQLGWGPVGSDPSVGAQGWTWEDASCHGECVSCGQADEYRAWLPALTSGDYSYVFRFRIQDGPWVYADRWPGSLDGLEVEDMGYLRVLPSEGGVLLSNLEPDYAHLEGADTVSLFGQGLSSQAELSIDGLVLESQFIGQEEIRFSSPVHSPGSVPLTLVQNDYESFQLTLPNALAFVRRHTPIVDGVVGEDWSDPYLLDSSVLAGDWGPNHIDSLYASFDDTFLYLAVRAWVDPDTSNSVVVYLDMDYGAASGVRDGDKLTDNTGYEETEGLDSSISGRFSVTDPGFGAEFALGTVGMAQVEESEQNPAVRNLAGLRDISDTGNFRWLPISIKTDDHAPGDGTVEIAIPWESLLGSKKLAGDLHIAFFARVVNSDGEYQCSCGLPEPDLHSPLDVDQVLVLDVQ